MRAKTSRLDSLIIRLLRQMREIGLKNVYRLSDTKITTEKWTEVGQFVIGVIVGLLFGGFIIMNIEIMTCTTNKARLFWE